MKRVVLVTCVKPKLDEAAQAQHLYQGPLFASLMAYAREQAPDSIYILSGKHHLLNLTDRIAPYDVNLNLVADQELLNWAKIVLNQLEIVADLKEDYFILLTNPVYAKYLKPKMANWEMPIVIE